MRNIFIIARRDLRAQFNSPVAYVVIGGTMLLLGVLFFLVPHMAVAGVAVGGFWEIDRATMDEMFTCLPPLMSLFVIPAITMRSLAAEKGSGTLELLITMPVRDSEVILGKYVASCAIVLILLTSTLLYPFAMFEWPWHLGALDWGPVWAGYLGCVFFSFAGGRRGDDALEPDRERRHRLLHDVGDTGRPLRRRPARRLGELGRLRRRARSSCPSRRGTSPSRAGSSTPARSCTSCR